MIFETCLHFWTFFEKSWFSNFVIYYYYYYLLLLCSIIYYLLLLVIFIIITIHYYLLLLLFTIIFTLVPLVPLVVAMACDGLRCGPQGVT